MPALVFVFPGSGVGAVSRANSVVAAVHGACLHQRTRMALPSAPTPWDRIHPQRQHPDPRRRCSDRSKAAQYSALGGLDRYPQPFAEAVVPGTAAVAAGRTDPRILLVGR